MSTASIFFQYHIKHPLHFFENTNIPKFFVWVSPIEKFNWKIVDQQDRSYYVVCFKNNLKNFSKSSSYDPIYFLSQHGDSPGFFVLFDDLFTTHTNIWFCLIFIWCLSIDILQIYIKILFSHCIITFITSCLLIMKSMKLLFLLLFNYQVHCHDENNHFN